MAHWTRLLEFDFWEPFFLNVIRIAFIFLFAYLASFLVNRLIKSVYLYSLRVMERGGGSDMELEKRAQTIKGVIRKVLTSLIWAIALIMILKELRFDIGPLLAGAGVVGIAIGLGAQSLIKDVINGLLLLLENQIRVGDVAVINNQGGLVEEINLRTTVLRSEEGAVHTFPNGNITTISNLTREFSYYVFTLSVGYKENTDRVIEVLKTTAADLMAEEPYHSAILAPLEVMGVDKLGDASVAIKARFKTRPTQQWMVGREMNRRIKMRFQDAQIELPFPSQTIQLAPALPPNLRNELKTLIREVLQEQAQ